MTHCKVLVNRVGLTHRSLLPVGPHHLWADADPPNVEPRPDFANQPLKASLSELVNWVYNRVWI